MSTRALVAVIAIAAVACGSTGSVPETSTSSTGVTTTTSQPETTTTGPVISTTSSPTTTSTIPEPLVEISAGEVTGADIVEVGLGNEVDIWVLSDIDDQIHVHGYDLFFDLEAGVPLNLTFSADIPGVFEVEVHTGNTHLLDIEVQG
jgi:hypothetical protein